MSRPSRGRSGSRPGSPRTRRQARRPARPLLTPEQCRDVTGVLLAGSGLLCLVALAVHGAPLMDGLRGLVLAEVGYGWPLVLGSVIAAGVLLVWPDPPAPPSSEDGDAAAAGPRRLRPWRPSWLEAGVAVLGELAALGVLGLAGAQAGGALGRLVRWLVSPAGPAGPLVLLLAMLLAAIVVVRLSPGRAGRRAVTAGRSAYAGRRRVAGLAGLIRRIAAGVRRRLPAWTVETSAKTAGESEGAAESEPAVADLVEVEGEAGGAEDGEERRTDWTPPGLELLAAAEAADRQTDTRQVSQLIVRTLADFNVEARVVSVSSGPAVTRYALQPAPGVQVRKVVALQNDLALALGGVALRIEAPIPGQAAVGIEVPNRSAALVTIGEVVRAAVFQRGQVLGVALGKDVAGRPVAGDLTRMPHLLIAGATGQGKSVCLNTLVCSLLLQHDPAHLVLVMVDPKRVELQGYDGLPHLAVPVIVDPHQAASALRWAVGEMERRYRVLADAGVRDIGSHNQRAAAAGEQPLPYVVIVIDELADLMMVAAGEVEELVCRIAQLARAVGIHLVIATQRPSVNVITGLIKANVPSRIAFAVGSQVDSRVILDAAGAEKLLGRGDMLYLPVDAGKPVRLQGAFISDREVQDLVASWRAQGEPHHLEGVLDAAPLAAAGGEREQRQLDPLFARAARAVAGEGVASVSLVQRRFNVGYSRAGRIVDQLAEHRVIGAYQGSKSREVLMSLPDVDELLERLQVEG